MEVGESTMQPFAEQLAPAARKPNPAGDTPSSGRIFNRTCGPGNHAFSGNGFDATIFLFGRLFPPHGPMNRLLPFTRTWMLCLLALIVGGCGPAVLFAAPISIRIGTEEESRCGDSHVLGGVVTISHRASRSSECRYGFCRLKSGPSPVRKGGSPAFTRSIASTLQTLQMRIQV